MPVSELTWKNELPTEEGIYLVDDLTGETRQVTIENMKIGSDPNRPDNFHVIEGEHYYALSAENGCSDWLWAKLS